MNRARGLRGLVGTIFLRPIAIFVRTTACLRLLLIVTLLRIVTLLLIVSLHRATTIGVDIRITRRVKNPGR